MVSMNESMNIKTVMESLWFLRGRWVLYRCVTMEMAVFHAVYRVLPSLIVEYSFLVFMLI